MQTVLFVLCALLWIAAGFLFTLSLSAASQVIACIIGLSGTVLFVGACIVGAIDNLGAKLTKESQ